ncbi:MAG: RagB/SusD family nutrient uptake outer membrane protein, partial [Chloroflexi bacterium]|nr:RagB/SusD family nutrient uptake outer membrane protein [Chloroflexota bacterium]
MKKIIIIVAVCILSACSNNFLEIYPETALNVANFYKNQDQFITSANGCYIGLRNYNKIDYWAINEIASDNSSFMFSTLSNAYLRGPSAYDLFLDYVDPTWEYGTDFWNQSYKGIYDCNVLLKNIERPEVTWNNILYKDRCIGEALFLRGLYYFNLVRAYGGVPIVLDPLTAQQAIDIKRSTETQVYEVVIKD